MISSILLASLVTIVSAPEARDADDAFRSALVTAIHSFAQEGELEHLKAIVEKYPELIDAKRTFRQPHKPGSTDSFTPLYHAAERGNEQIVAYLLEKRADVNIANGLGWTPLHLAAREGHLSVVKLLLKHGAKVGAKTVALPEEFGRGPGASRDDKPRKIPAVPAWTALDLAKRNKHAAVVEFLKTADAADKSKKADQPISALIVVEGIISRQGVGEMKAIRIIDREKLSRLESFFPNYRKRPSSNEAAPWIARYRVYFNFPDGKSIRLTVSHNANARFWSAGRGDFELKGDFNKFVASLQRAAVIKM